MRIELLNNNNNSSSSLEERVKGDENLNADTSDILSIEGLRRTYNSCSNCGVSWFDDHVSLDCGECGGYAMRRPCPRCDGHCGKVWRRDAKASHVSKQAQWTGTCSADPQWRSEDANANYQTNFYTFSKPHLVAESHLI